MDLHVPPRIANRGPLPGDVQLCFGPDREKQATGHHSEAKGSAWKPARNAPAGTRKGCGHGRLSSFLRIVAAEARGRHGQGPMDSGQNFITALGGAQELSWICQHFGFASMLEVVRRRSALRI